jgi:pSer/pThr/pTyr-binding forkhead associated (FHA) protein
MVDLRFLTGKQAGASWSARRFPVRLGRSRQADLQILEDGVWDHHAELQFVGKEGFVLQGVAEGQVLVNGKPVNEVRLRNGDQISLGSAKLQFWISRTEQKKYRVQEGLFWVALAGICVGQFGLLYWLNW